MADESVNQTLFTWIISTISTGIFAGLAWLGIHTKRLNELNVKIAVAATREESRDEKITDIQADIKEIKDDRVKDMKDIRQRWDEQLKLHTAALLESQKLTSVLLVQTKAITSHQERLELVEKHINFKVTKS